MNININKKVIIFVAIIIVAVIIIAVGIYGIIKVIPRYHNPYSERNLTEDISLIVGQSDRTEDLLDPIVVKDNRILFSFDNMKRFIDAYIQNDTKYNQIITNSKTNTKVIDVENKKMREFLDENWEDIYLEMINNEIYFDICAMQDIYNIDVKYIKETNLVKVAKDIHTYKVGVIKDETKLKYLPSNISTTIDKLLKDQEVYVLREDKEYYKVLDSMGRFGYVKQENIGDIENVTNYFPMKYDEKINLVWDYVNFQSPNRIGQTKLEGVNVFSPTWIDLLDENGNIQNKVDKSYLKWAKDTGYDIWVMFSNNSKIQSTNNILNDSKLREKVIKDVLQICLDNNFEGINVDFEYMYKEDKDMYSQFIRELSVAFHKHNIFVSVDVTVPDGSERWSLCFDRKALGDAVDYVMLMAYDQTPGSSQKPGSVSAKNWVELNVKKLLTEVDKEKLVLGMPLYTRSWKTVNNQTTSSTVNMKDVESYVSIYLSSNYTKVWLENEGQYYIEDTVGNIKRRMWVEDLKSIEEKLKIYKENDLAGVATWEKDSEDYKIWDLINQYL